VVAHQAQDAVTTDAVAGDVAQARAIRWGLAVFC
jgi:hypothetical protein